MGTVFGDLLRQVREDARVSMGTLARHLGISVPYLSDVERGNRLPFNNERIRNIAVFLKVDPVPLLTAAARSRGFFELTASSISPTAERVGAALLRGWPTLSDDKLNQIASILEEDPE